MVRRATRAASARRGAILGAWAVVAGCTLRFDPALLDGACGGIADGAACRDTAGTCHAGACCTGCWDGAACVDGGSAVSCGAEGAACRTCSAPTNQCAAGHCAIERRVVSLANGAVHLAFVDGLGALWTFGFSAAGALGRTDDAALNRVGGDGAWRAAAASCCGADDFTLATTIDDALATCGLNQDYQLADGTSTSRVALATVDRRAWASVAAGAAFGCGVLSTGTLWCWGWNGKHALGRTTTEDHVGTPLQVNADTDWASVAARDDHACAIKRDATLWCWGGGVTGRTSTSIVGPVEPATSWREVSVGDEHACGIRLDGSLYCWGDNADGKLGVPGVSASVLPVRVGDATTWKHVAGGRSFTCGTQIDGSLWCWGTGNDGELGTGADVSTTRRVPTRVGTRTDWNLISAGIRSACAVSDDGLLWCWGNGSEIPFGNEPRLEPTLVSLSP